MRGLTILTSFAALVSAALNTTQSYKLKTHLKPCSADKVEFADLYLLSYHTGAGLGDATFVTNSTLGRPGFLNETGASVSGITLYNQEFDLGTSFPWMLEMATNTVFYSAWQPVRLNAGGYSSDPSASGFFLNETGLQWSSTPDAPGASGDTFGGWLVCDWWHSVPQLFFRLSYYNDRAPSPASCADVLLVPEYI